MRSRVLLALAALMLLGAAYLGAGDVHVTASSRTGENVLDCAWNGGEDIGFTGPDPCATERRVVDGAVATLTVLGIGAAVVGLRRAARSRSRADVR